MKQTYPISGLFFGKGLGFRVEDSRWEHSLKYPAETESLARRFTITTL